MKSNFYLRVSSALKAFLMIVIFGVASSSYAMEYSSIDSAKSQITFTSKLMGSKISGGFGKFSGKISFNPDEPEKAKANLVIDIASFNAGGDELQEEAKGKDWFSTKLFPTASYATDSVKVTGSNSLDIRGTLTIKGKTVSLLIAVKYQPHGKQMVFDANFQVLRLDFGLGAGNWADTSAVANEVPVNVRLVLNQK
ncbi:YceI family protein [Polynucleobacter necessarius]|uniref:YceI family protein n=1 Tax=Polynucleobacter necessarius TaxID=576610 RepID=UPI000E096167|nr:YceI family protein [Polynucleobacter necessarius]